MKQSTTKKRKLTDNRFICAFAEQFYWASKVLSQHEQEGDHVMNAIDNGDKSKIGELAKFRDVRLPRIVSLAFCLELMLKALHAKINQEYPEGHELEALYSTLPNQTKVDLRNACDCSETQFAKLLNMNSKAFETFRYFHEYQQGQFAEPFAYKLADALMNHLQ